MKSDISGALNKLNNRPRARYATMGFDAANF